ncbi:uncharacterized protein [Drosophila tropicalis]|uniref:uncharacterized protein n=1 Tax=Drosophila tropicalis TaxID=46794 RepID=UPI0035AB6FA1
MYTSMFIDKQKETDAKMDDLIIFEDLKFNLNFFPGLGNMSNEMKAMFFENLKERIGMMHNGEFFNAKEMVLIDPQKLYALNVDEFWHHSDPYVHKIFVMYLTDLDTHDQVLIYAQSTNSMEKESDEYMTNAEVTSDTILSMLEQVPPDVRQNVVAIVADRFRMNLSVMNDVYLLCSYKPPPFVFDVTYLLSTFAKKDDVICISTVEKVLKTHFRKESYVEQLINIRAECCSEYVFNLRLVREFIKAIRKTLRNIFRFRNEIYLTNLESDLMERHGKNIVSLMPIMSEEECSKGGGLLNFMVFDVAKQLKL